MPRKWCVEIFSFVYYCESMAILKKISSFYINAHLLDLSRLDIPSLTEIMHFQNERSEKVAHSNKHYL